VALTVTTMTVAAGTVALQATAAHAASRGAAPQEGAPGGAAEAVTAKAAKRLSKAVRQHLLAAKAVAVAKRQLGDPYVYGADGPRAFDCSGLVQFAWRKAGVSIPRVTTSQYRAIDKKVSWDHLRPGDLLFFHGKGHVGMYVGHHKMIHAPHSGSTVRIEKLGSWRRHTFDGAVRPGG
jgi:cell wall-associated NlpC family hydrolase